MILSYEYAKVYSEDGVILNHRECSTVLGEVHEIPFGGLDVIHAEVLIQNMESKVFTELVILKGGLHSGIRYFLASGTPRYVISMKQNMAKSPLFQERFIGIVFVLYGGSVLLTSTKNSLVICSIAMFYRVAISRAPQCKYHTTVI